MGFKEVFSNFLPSNITIIGVSGSGKTTFYGWLLEDSSLDHSKTTSSTGITREITSIGGKKFRMIDTAGQVEFRKWWDSEVDKAKMVLFFVDMMDPSTYADSKEQLLKFLQKVKDRSKKLVLVLNKIDLFEPNNKDRTSLLNKKLVELVEYFEFNDVLKDQGSFTIIPVSAKTGENCDKLIKIVYRSITGYDLDTRLTVDNMVIVDRDGIVQFHKGNVKNLEDKIEGALSQLITKGIEIMAGSEDPEFQISRGDNFVAFYKTPDFYLSILIDKRLNTERAKTVLKESAEFLIRTKWIHCDEKRRLELISELMKDQLSFS